MLNSHHLPGTIRARLPQETLRWVEPHLADFGITRLADISDLDKSGIPVAVCVRPQAKGLSVSQGKGLTRDLARVSAVMEAIERWHAEHIPLPNWQESADTLSLRANVACLQSLGQGVIALSDLSKRPLPWLPAQCLLSQQNYYLPYHAVSLDSFSQPELSLYFHTSSKGLASGNTYQEALLHALFEWIEMFSYQQFLRLPERDLPKRLVGLTTIDDDTITPLLQAIKSAQLQLAIVNLTTIADAPVFNCFLYDPRTGLVCNGKGAHFCKSIALTRALTEAVQSRLTLISGARDDLKASNYKNPIASALFNPANRAEQDFSQLTSGNVGSHDDMVQRLSARLAEQSVSNIFVCDLTSPRFAIPVVKVIIPELLC